MCIGVWTLEHPDYALIICTNRDENLDRPTEDAHFHSFQKEQRQDPNYSPDSGNVLSGRDVKGGGSWFGVNRAGRVALLTNITEPPSSFTSSRGYLVSSFLLSDSSCFLELEVDKLVPSATKFAGFNLLLLMPTPSKSTILMETGTSEGRGQEPAKEEATMSSREHKLAYDAILVTNHGAGGHLETRRLTTAERTCGCISNGIDGKGGNEWPKVQVATSKFEEVLKNFTTDKGSSNAENELVERLFDILTWQPPEPVTERAQFRNTIQVTPIPIPDGVKVAPPHNNPHTSVAIPSAVSVSSPGTSGLVHPAQPATPVATGFHRYNGTRLSTVLLIRREGSISFIERDIWRLDDNGEPERPDDHQIRGERRKKDRIFEFNLGWK